MTDVLITIDTELSAGLHQRGFTPEQNIASSIDGSVAGGSYGVGWLMDEMERCAIRGVFFVDPMPALVYGADILPRIVQPFIERGHEVQLHIHTEWLHWVSDSPVGGRQGRNIGDFDLEDQVVLLDLARDLLERAGAPRPNAFRAGNFGADARTLAALARLGLLWDSSFNAACPDDPCRIGNPIDGNAPVRHGGVIELPVAGLFDRPGHLRPAQVCALSSWEMSAALHHAAGGDEPFVVVSHSFEMLSRDRRRPNRAVMARWRRMCERIASQPELRSAGFHDLDPDTRMGSSTARPLLGPNRVRTAGRMVEQAISTILYERRG